MFGEGWHLLIGLLLLLSILWGNLPLFVLSLALALVALLAALWGRYCLDGVTYGRHLSQTRAFCGEEVELTVVVANRKLLPLPWLEVEDELPAALALSPARLTVTHKAGRAALRNLFALRPYERVRRHYRLRCETRGYHAFGPAALRSGDLFGLARRELSLEAEDHLLVYPRLVPLARLGLPAADPFGDRGLRRWLFQDPLRTVGVREYVPGDSPRRIHWAATARLGELQVKVYEPTTTYRLVVVLNLNTFGDFWWWLGFDRQALELGITVAASLANWAVERGYQVGLLANGNAGLADLKIKVPTSRDPRQLTHVLEALARVLPFATMPLPQLLAEEGRTLPNGATVVLVTCLLDEAIISQLRRLRAAGHPVALLLVGKDAPHFAEPGLIVHRIADEQEWATREEVAADASLGVAASARRR
ncbi:MAG: DUF58 domain-containing protein [Chloroflexota bacterium]